MHQHSFPQSKRHGDKNNTYTQYTQRTYCHSIIKTKTQKNTLNVLSLPFYTKYFKVSPVNTPFLSIPSLGPLSLVSTRVGQVKKITRTTSSGGVTSTTIINDQSESRVVAAANQMLDREEARYQVLFQGSQAWGQFHIYCSRRETPSVRSSPRIPWQGP